MTHRFVGWCNAGNVAFAFSSNDRFSIGILQLKLAIRATLEDLIGTYNAHTRTRYGISCNIPHRTGENIRRKKVCFRTRMTPENISCDKDNDRKRGKANSEPDAESPANRIGPLDRSQKRN